MGIQETDQGFGPLYGNTGPNLNGDLDVARELVDQLLQTDDAVPKMVSGVALKAATSTVAEESNRVTGMKPNPTVSATKKESND